MLEFDLEFGLGVSGVVVLVSIEEDRLKREAKLERLDLDFSALTGDCFVKSDVVGVLCSAEWVDGSRAISSGGCSDSCEFLFLCFSVTLLTRKMQLYSGERTEIPESKHVEIN